MKPAERIIELLRERESNQSPAIERMRRIRSAYDGDIIVPLPELDDFESASVANLVAQGLDQTAMRISSTMPDIICPPSDPESKNSEKNSRVRRKALYGMWESNNMGLKMMRRARHFIGYASSPVSLRFDPVKGGVEWVLRDPLTTYPSPVIGPDDLEPTDCIFTYDRTWAWLKLHYPDQAHRLRGSDTVEESDLFQLVEYVDHEETVLIAVGRTPQNNTGWSRSVAYTVEPLAELERFPNRIGMCPAVVPGRVCLDQAQGQFDGMIGMYQTQARLMALEVIAVQKGIFPDTWLVARAGEQPQIINNANGLTGEIGQVKGGDLRDSTLNPGFMTNPTIDRLERAQRLTAGIPPEFGGESGSNIRTGRRGEAVMSAVVDFPIQEAQKVIAASLEAENRRAIALSKAYAGNKAVSFYVTTKGSKGRVDYTPNKHFDTDHNRVVFSNPGTDLNGLVIGAGQRIGMGTMSKKSFMEIDPMVDDVESEHDEVVSESLEQALLASLQTQASQGAIPPGDVARIVEMVRYNKADLAGAVQKVHEEAQERQATQVPPDSPEAQSGIAQAGAGAEAAPTPGAAGLPSMRELLAQVGG